MTSQRQSNIVSTKQISDGPIGAGSTWRQASKFLGRKVEFDIEMTSYEPSHQFSGKIINRPIPVESASKFEARDGGRF